MENRYVVRWYVIVCPAGGRAMASPLERERVRRTQAGEPLFDYFAPMFVEAREVKGRMVDTERPLLYNYLFIHASECEIYRLKSIYPQYNFLPRVVDGDDRYHYPYLSDTAMEQLKWIARSYADHIPLCTTADPAWLRVGDRIRITQGRFKGLEAKLVVQPRSKHREIVVSLENCLWVPLLKVRPGEYELIELSETSNHNYAHLNNSRMQEALHEALMRHHRHATTEADRATAREALNLYGALAVDSDVMRCRLYALLLPAYTILCDERHCNELNHVMQLLLPAVKAEQSRALLALTLYACQDSSIYRDLAHELIAPWQVEPAPKRSKAQLLRWLQQTDSVLKH